MTAIHHGGELSAVGSSPLLAQIAEGLSMAPAPHRRNSYEMLLDPGMPDTPQPSPQAAQTLVAFATGLAVVELGSAAPTPQASPYSPTPQATSSPINVVLCEEVHARERRAEVPGGSFAMLLDPGLPTTPDDAATPLTSPEVRSDTQVFGEAPW